MEKRVLQTDETGEGPAAGDRNAEPQEEFELFLFNHLSAIDKLGSSYPRCSHVC